MKHAEMLWANSTFSETKVSTCFAHKKTYFGSGIFFQRVSNEDQIFEARKLSEVIKLPPLSDVVVRDVEHLQLREAPDRLQAVDLKVTLISGQSYKQFKIIIYKSWIVTWAIF